MELFGLVDRMEYRMPRPLRTHAPDSIYHVDSRGVEKRPIFMDDADRRMFLALLKKALGAHGAALVAYCLMTNHYHLAIAIRETPLGVVMHDLLTEYALYFNRRYARVGHLFQGRYHAKLVSNDGYLAQVVAYIHLNPVKAGIVSHPGDWAWSSHRELVSGMPVLIDLARVEELTGFTPEEFRELYLEKLAQPSEPVEEIAAIEHMIQRTAQKFGLRVEELKSNVRGDALSKARAELAAWAAEKGISDSRLARALHCSRPAVTRARKRHVTDCA
jgi:putative transposase